MAPLTKADKQTVKKQAEFVNGDFFDNFIRSLSQYFSGTTGNMSKMLYNDWVEGEPAEDEPLVLY